MITNRLKCPLATVTIVESILMAKILIVHFLSLTFLAFTFLGSVDLNAQSRKALLIGVSQYPSEGGWATIHSTNDVGLIKAALNSQGFKDNDIIEVLDDKATKKGILNALNNDLLPKVNRGDIIYFQFSGHGQQRPDIDGDEVDGLDECIVSFDSPKKFQEGIYEGENLISDDELNRNLTKIREKLGPKGQLLVVLDACHSGTGTRGAALVRGTTEVMASPSFQKQNQMISMKSDNNGLQNK
ncbi:MAG: caspase family protein, partial [Saprospiraceae bacterium]